MAVAGGREEPERASRPSRRRPGSAPVAYDLALLATTLGRYDDADAHFAAAVDLQGSGAGALLAQSYLEWGHMLLARQADDDPVRAGRLLDQALGIARDLGQGRVEERVTRLRQKISFT